MVTLCYDEAGYFENKKDDKYGFIAGFMFDDMEIAKETLNEKKRVCAFLKMACDKVGAQFPKDLHVDDAYNRVNVAKVKEEYSKHLERFIKDGTYNGMELLPEKREGKYLFIIEIASKDTKSKYSDETSFVSDKVYSNLYDHLVTDYIVHSLYTNPYINIDSVNCDFPSRVFVVKDDLEFYTKVGYSYFITPDEKVLIYDLGEETLRAKMNDLMGQNTQKSIKLKELKGRSIRNGYKALDEDEQNSYAFLFLADVICTFFKNHIKEDCKWERYEQVFRSKLNTECCIFVYSDIDDIYTSLYKNLDLNNICQSFSDLCLIQNSSGDTTEFYKRTKLNQVRKLINNKITYEEYLNIYKDIKSKNKSLNKDIKKIIKTELSELVSIYDYNLSEQDRIIVYDVELILDNECELLFSKAYESIKESRFYDAYNYLLEIDKITNRLGKTKELYELIDNNIDERTFAILAKRIDTETLKENINDNILDIFNKALELKESLKILDYNSYDNCVFDLYDAGIAINNHLGNTSKCREYFEIIDSIKEFDDSKYKKQLNRHIVHLIDSLDFDLAYIMARKTVLEFGNKNLKIKEFNPEEELTDHIKTISQLSQVCAFINEHNLVSLKDGSISKEQFEIMKTYPDKGFKSAIDKFMIKDPANARLSINYYLHYLVDKVMNLEWVYKIEELKCDIKKLESKTKTNAIKRKIDRSKKELEHLLKENTNMIELRTIKDTYFEYSKIYFNGLIEPKERMKYILDNNRNYDLFLLCKSLVAFYSEEDIKKVFTNDVIQAIDEMICESHPYEITCYYLALIMKKINNKNKEKEYYKRLCTFVEESYDIIKIISINLKYKYLLMVKDDTASAVKIELENEIKVFTNGRLPIDDEVDKIITYTYS